MNDTSGYMIIITGFIIQASNPLYVLLTIEALISILLWAWGTVTFTMMIPNQLQGLDYTLKCSIEMNILPMQKPTCLQCSCNKPRTHAGVCTSNAGIMPLMFINYSFLFNEFSPEDLVIHEKGNLYISVSDEMYLWIVESLTV